MIKIAIVDDDAIVCGQLRELLIRNSIQTDREYDVEVFSACEDYLARALNGIHYDLLFLDILFEAMDGVALGTCIREQLLDAETEIVYISSMSEYSMQLFRIHVFDFLLKPLTAEKVNQCMADYCSAHYLQNRCLTFFKNKAEHSIPLTQIKYLQSKAKKILICTAAEPIEFYGQLADYAAMPCLQSFLLIHKSFLVNPLYVDRFCYDHVIIKDGIRLPISKTKQKTIRAQLKKEKGCI